MVLTFGLGIVGLFLARGVASATRPGVVATLIPLVLIVLGFVVFLIALFRRKLR